MKKILPVLLCSLVLFGFGCREKKPESLVPVYTTPQSAVEIKSAVVVDQLQQSFDPDAASIDVHITSVKSSDTAWLVLYGGMKGNPTMPIAHKQIEKGKTKDVTISFDRKDDNPQYEVFVLVHEDKGTLGTFEFPEYDLPAADATATKITLQSN